MTRREIANKLCAAVAEAIMYDPKIQEAVRSYLDVGERVLGIAFSLEVETTPVEQELIPKHDNDFLRSLRIAPDLGEGSI